MRNVPLVLVALVPAHHLCVCSRRVPRMRTTGPPHRPLLRSHWVMDLLIYHGRRTVLWWPTGGKLHYLQCRWHVHLVYWYRCPVVRAFSFLGYTRARPGESADDA